jgi:hypothetical protein
MKSEGDSFLGGGRARNICAQQGMGSDQQALVVQPNERWLPMTAFRPGSDLLRAHCACLLLQGEARPVSILIYPPPLSTRPHLGPSVHFVFRDPPVSSSPAITFLTTSVTRSAFYSSPLETRLFIVAPLCRTFSKAACGAQRGATEGLALSVLLSDFRFVT